MDETRIVWCHSFAKIYKKHLTFLSKGSLVFSVPWQLFLSNKIQDSSTRQLHFLQEMLINIKTRHFHSSNQEQLFFTEQISLATFVLWILQSFIERAFL